MAQALQVARRCPVWMIATCWNAPETSCRPIPRRCCCWTIRPGSGGVGGDWYDVFTLPTGELCVVIGDVAGSGLPAAVIMGRMRSALRLRAGDPGSG